MAEQSKQKHPRGIAHVWYATQTALAGLRGAWQNEDAFRQEILVAIIAIPVALFSPADKLGKVLMIASILLVLILELVNTAIEAAVDHTSTQKHPLAARAKDVASAAVLLSIVNAVVVWSLVLLL